MAFRLPAIDPRIKAELVAQKRPIALGLACSAVAAILTVGTAKFVELVLDAISKKNGTMLMTLSGVVIVLFGVKYFFTRGQSLYLSEAANRLTAGLRERLFAKLMRLPVSYFNERRAGGIQSVLTNDVNVFQTAVTVTRDAVDGPIKVVGGFCYLVYLNWQLTLAAMLVLPFMVTVIQRNSRKMKVAQREVQEDLGELTAMMQESIQGSRTIKAFAAEDDITGRFEGLVQRSFSSQMKAARRIASLRPMVELIGASALAIVVLVCGMLVNQGKLEVAHLGAFLFTLDQINQGFKNLGSLNQTLSSVHAATERIYENILDAEEPIVDQEGARELAVTTGRIEFRDVHFAYPDGTEALRGVSFVIESGTSLALVGSSGAGKSTIADLLMRFYDPTSGQILLDGIDIRELKLSWLRRQIGVVPQQTFLFSGSIADNLRLGCADATDSAVERALKAAHADGFVGRLEGGDLAELGERGAKLSGGEAQRLSIARALVSEPPVLLLDEATSNLDAESERHVTEALTEIMQSRTSLFIAHRLSTAARATRIAVMGRGKVLEIGSHHELVAAGGPYANLYRLYTSGVSEETLG